MQYWLNTNDGIVSSVDDNEEPRKVLPAGAWLPVHIHPNVEPDEGVKYAGTLPFKPPADPRRRPPRLFSTAFIVFASLVSTAAISAALAAAILSVRWLLDVVS